MFSMEILAIKRLEKVSCEKIYDKDLNDYRSVLADICNVFQQSNSFKFLVSGFGQDEWPVDCSFDLLSIIEQLPEVIKGIANDMFDFRMDFYEQGIEREVVFVDKQNHVQVFCKSRTDWIPKPDKMIVKKKEVARVIMKLYEDFLLYAEFMCKDLFSSELMKEFIIADLPNIN